jgi:Putative phage serine protease XkdF
MTEQPLSGRAMRWAAHARARSEMFRPMRLGVDELAKALAADDANEAIDEANDTGLTECPRCGFTGPVEAVRRHRKRAGHEEAAPDEDADAQFALTKAAPEKRYALGVLYMPNRLDAHSEWSTADDLHDALWDFARNGDKKLRKQHGNEVIGEVVEAFVWPFAHDADLIQADGTLRKAELPAGTAYIGAVFTPEGWAEVKSGKRRGFSMGGSTVRLKEALPS